jgi:uncharacterized protein (DUF4415 family)
VTLQLGMDVAEWSKSYGPEGRYQTEISRVLRQYVAGEGR